MTRFDEWWAEARDLAVEQDIMPGTAEWLMFCYTYCIEMALQRIGEIEHDDEPKDDGL